MVLYITGQFVYFFISSSNFLSKPKELLITIKSARFKLFGVSLKNP